MGAISNFWGMPGSVANDWSKMGDRDVLGYINIMQSEVLGEWDVMHQEGHVCSLAVSQAMRLLIPSTRSKGKGASAPYGIENIKKDIASGYLICVRCNPPPPSPPPNPNPNPNTTEGRAA
jgi:hypothetical protein